MKRLFALLMALLCTAMLLTPALAAPEDEGGDATTATDAAGGETTGDPADGAATGDEATGDPSDSAAAGETGTSDDAVLAETSYQSVELQVTVDNSGRAYIQGTLSLNIVGSLQEIAVGFPKDAKSPKIEGYKTSSANQNSLKVLTVESDSGFTGVQTFQISYSLSKLVSAGEASQVFTLPLLSPQEYPDRKSVGRERV